MADPIRPTEVIGSSGLNRSGGFVYEEFHAKLKGTLGVKAYREMSENDATVGAMLFAVKTLIRQVPWFAKPADASVPADDARQFLEECRQDMSHAWEDLISENLSELVYGWAYHEIVYKFRGGPSNDPTQNSKFSDGKIGWRKIALRSQDTLNRWEFDDDGGIRGMHQLAAPNFQAVFLPIEKCLLFRTEAHKNNPEGRSILRTAYRSWFFKKKHEEIEGVRAEKDATGFLVFQVPPEIMAASPGADNAALRTAYELQIQKSRVDERGGFLIPSELDQDGKPTGYKLTNMATGGAPAIDSDKVIRRYAHDIAMTLMAEFMLLGSTPNGTRSLADSKTELFATALGTILDGIASVYNRFAVPRLMALNGYSPEVYPTLCHGDIESRNLAELGTFVQQMITAGVFQPTPELERELLSQAKLPQPEAEGT